MTAQSFIFSRSTLTKSRRTVAVVEPKPNIVLNPAVVLESHSPDIRAGNTHTVYLPAIISPPVQVHIAYIVCTRTSNIICICGARLESTRGWIVNPWHINLQLPECTS